MRKLLGIGAVVLGAIGLLLCAAAVGIGWWAMFATIARLDGVAARLDRGLSEVDAQLVRVESRIESLRTDLDAVRGAAETIASEHPDLLGVQAEIELLFDRLVLNLDRADALANSLTVGAAGLRTLADIVDQFNDNPEATVSARKATDTIDRAADSLNSLRARVEALKLAKAVQLTRELVTLAREATAGSERLANGLAAARRDITLLRKRATEWQNKVASWMYVAATANTFIWLWGGLGQLCLIGWGRTRFDGRKRV